MQITSGERVEIVGLITRTPLFELLQPVPMRQDRSIGQFVPTTVEVHFRGCTQVDWFEVVCHWCHRAPQVLPARAHPQRARFLAEESNGMERSRGIFRP